MVFVPHESTSTHHPKHHARNPYLFRNHGGERYDPVGHNTRHRRNTLSRAFVDFIDEDSQCGEEVPAGGLAESKGFGWRVGIRRGGDAIGEGLEAKVGEARGYCGGGSEDAVVVAFGVDEGYVEAVAVEKLG